MFSTSGDWLDHSVAESVILERRWGAIYIYIQLGQTRFGLSVLEAFSAVQWSGTLFFRTFMTATEVSHAYSSLREDRGVRRVEVLPFGDEVPDTRTASVVFRIEVRGRLQLPSTGTLYSVTLAPKAWPEVLRPEEHVNAAFAQASNGLFHQYEGDVRDYITREVERASIVTRGGSEGGTLLSAARYLVALNRLEDAFLEGRLEAALEHLVSPLPRVQVGAVAVPREDPTTRYILEKIWPSVLGRLFRLW